MTTEKVERRLTVIVSADVVGYSRLTEADEAGTRAALNAHRNELIDPKLAERHGRLVSTAGDSLLVEFSSVVEAVQCAVEIQRGMRVRNGDIPDDRRIVFRIGINLGDIIIEGDDIHGEGVNVAARLQTLAEPGGICISGESYRQVEGKVDVGFADLGDQTVKNITKPIRVYRVLQEPEAAGKVVGQKDARKRLPKRWRWAIPAAAAVVVIGVAAGVLLSLEPWVPRVEAAIEANMAFPLPEQPSIAVLPFDNVGDDPSQNFFAEGITKDIITHLSKDPNLFVIDRASASAHAGQPVKQVAEALGVQYVLQGTVQRSGETLRITADFIDALSGRREWSERYDRSVGDLFALQDDITRNVSVAIGVVFQSEQVREERALSGENLEAWELSSQAHFHYHRGTPEGNAKARNLYQQAIEVGGEMPAFLGLLAWTHFNDAYFGYGDDPPAAFARAKELQERVVALAPDWAGARYLEAAIVGYEGRQAEAIALAREAVAMSPNDAAAKFLLAALLNNVGQTDEALPLIREAMRLNPIATWMKRWVANIELTADDFEGALRTAQELLDEGNGEGHYWFALTYGRMERMDEAAKAIAAYLEVRPDFTLDVARNLWRYKIPEIRDRRMAVMRALGLPAKAALPLPDKPSIAVLPFENLSDDPEQEYFVDGMTDTLITDLSRIPELFVIARNTSFTYKGKAVDVKAVGRELGVRYILEGSVQRAGGWARINTQLVDATTGGHVWAERYDRELDNIFAVQDAIIVRVVRALELHLTDTQQKHRGKGSKTTSLEAYDLVLRARKLLDRFDHEAAAEARDLLQRAIEIDPAYSEAYSLLGFYYFDEWRVWGRKRDQNLARALDFAKTAVELSPSEPAPHVLLALVYQWRREFDAANAAADTALALKPNDAITLSNLGSMLNWAGRSEEALGVLHQAVRLDPFHPPTYLERLAFAYSGIENYDQCVEVAKRGVALEPNYVGLHVTLAQCYVALGTGDEARAAAAEIVRTKPRFTLKAYAAYAPYTDDRVRRLDVERLRKAGVPESGDEIFRQPEGHMTGEQIRVAISGQAFVDTLPERFAGTVNTYDPSGAMSGHPQPGSPAERFGNDQGKWWIKGDRFCRKWNRWVAGRTECFSFVRDGDAISWINRYGEFHSEMKKLD